MVGGAIWPRRPAAKTNYHFQGVFCPLLSFFAFFFRKKVLLALFLARGNAQPPAVPFGGHEK
jgi:hypothetical protein